VLSNKHGSVYAAVIVSIHGTAGVSCHPVHLMNAEQRLVAIDLWTKPVGLSC